MGRPLKPLVLADDEREQLKLIARRPKTSQRVAMRARIVLAAASGASNNEVAEKTADAILAKVAATFSNF